MRAQVRSRLLVVSQPPIAGVPRAVLDLLEQLPGDEWDIDVACPPGTDLWNGLDGRADVRRHPIPNSRGPVPADLAAFVRLVRLAARADVIHAHSSKAGFLARLAALVTGRRGRCVFTPHGWSFWAFEGRAASFYVRFERFAARWCRTIIAVSAFERDAGLAAGIGRPEQYRVIPNGIDTDRFARTREPIPGRIVMVARLAEPKLPELAVRSLYELRRRVPDASLVLVGDGPLRAHTEAVIAELELGDAVQLTGVREDVPDLLATAACALHASRYEGCALTVLEAMAAAVPVVATHAGGMDELVLDGVTGFLAGYEPSDVADRLAVVLEDAALAERLGLEGRRRALAGFTRATMRRATTDVYSALLR